MQGSSTSVRGSNPRGTSRGSARGRAQTRQSNPAPAPGPEQPATRPQHRGRGTQPRDNHPRQDATHRGRGGQSETHGRGRGRGNRPDNLSLDQSSRPTGREPRGSNNRSQEAERHPNVVNNQQVGSSSNNTTHTRETILFNADVETADSRNDYAKLQDLEADAIKRANKPSSNVSAVKKLPQLWFQSKTLLSNETPPRRKPSSAYARRLVLPLTSEQLTLLKKWYPGMQFDYQVTHQLQDHPLSHIARTIDASLAIDRLSVAIHPGFKIVDIGGKDNLWRADQWYNHIWCTRPVLDASDVMRSTENSIDCDCKFPSTCVICENPDAYVSIHSLYYLKQEDVLAAVYGCKNKTLIATVHCFDGVTGLIPGGEMIWRKENGQITMSSANGGSAYTHPDINWCFIQNSFVSGDSDGLVCGPYHLRYCLP